MTRTVTTAFQSALEASSVTLFFAVDLAFDTANLRLWTGIGNKTILGNVFTGTGSLLGIDGLNEANDLGAKGATITLTGIDTSLISTALTEPYQGRSCTIYLGVEGAADVAVVFKGYMDVMTIEDAAETATISISVESTLAKLERPVVYRYTSESQKDRYSGDTFFDWVAKLADKSVYWGRLPKDD